MAVNINKYLYTQFFLKNFNINYASEVNETLSYCCIVSNFINYKGFFQKIGFSYEVFRMVKHCVQKP